MFSSSAIAKTLRTMAATEDGDKVAAKFFSFVKRYNLNDLVPSVLSNLEGSAGASDEFETLKIRVPRALSEEGEAWIRKIVGAKKDVKVGVKIDRSVLGGFVANYRGFEYEGSFERAVNNLEKEIKNS